MTSTVPFLALLRANGADVIDIAVIAFLVYWLLILIRNSRHFFVFSGLITLAGVYFTASLLQLRMTLAFFNAFFGVLVLGLVLIFQDELRKFFEVIAFWKSNFKTRVLKTSPMLVDDIVNAVERMANKKVGLIIVIKGKEMLLRYLQGGFCLNGEVSEPLLQSIFDPSSPGHDGAVIIEGDRVSRFGVHLPLSHDFSQLRQYGTRHSAALGLAERADSLVIVVSEERGQISVAQEGRLKLVGSAVELRDMVDIFLKKKFIVKEDNKRQWRSKLKYKVLAALIAIGLWFVI